MFDSSPYHPQGTIYFDSNLIIDGAKAYWIKSQTKVMKINGAITKSETQASGLDKDSWPEGYYMI